MSDRLSKALRRAEEAFEIHDPRVEDRESGFEADGLEDNETQFRRACRALNLAGLLLNDGAGGLGHLKHFTAMIELSFYALERTCHALLIGAGKMEPHERKHHAEILGSSHQIGLWRSDDSYRMQELYLEFRTVHYYQRGLSTRDKAMAMFAIAQEAHRLAMHSQILNGDTCIC